MKEEMEKTLLRFKGPQAAVKDLQNTIKTALLSFNKKTGTQNVQLDSFLIHKDK